jgi:hypothetical protein
LEESAVFTTRSRPLSPSIWGEQDPPKCYYLQIDIVTCPTGSETIRALHSEPKFKRTLLEIFKSSRMLFGETVADSSKDCSVFTFSVKQSKQCEEKTLDCLTLKINELVTSETSGSIYWMAECHIRDDLNFQKHYCDNLNITPQNLTSSLRLGLEGTNSTVISQ